MTRSSSRRLFGTSGIRGPFNKLDPSIALNVALAFAKLLNNEGTVGVAGDARLTTSCLKSSVIAGLTAGGVNVIDYGTVPTPALLHAVKNEKLDGAIMVTGSHTPPNINGLLFFLSDTAEMPERMELELENIYFTRSAKRVPWNEVGRVTYGDALKHYLENLMKIFGNRSFEEMAPLVVLDHGNGVSALAAPKILSALGCKIINLNGNIDSTFPSRPPFPKPEVLRLLATTVRRLKATFGVGMDGDGDRAIFADERGQILWGDITGAIFAEEELRQSGGGVIVCPINTSRLVEYVANKYNARVIYTRVGPPRIVEELKKEPSAVFAFEETGKYIWPWNILYGDPLVAICKMLEIVGEGKLLGELADSLPRLHMYKRAIPCSDECKLRVMANVRRIMRRALGDGEWIEIDGVKVVLEDGSWILIRPSGTEPVIRCYVESPSEVRARSLLKFGLKALKEAMSL